MPLPNEGPRTTINHSCFACRHCKSESYHVQSDSGHTVSCMHESQGPKGKYISDSRWDTPAWCPFLQSPAAPGSL